MQFMTSRTRRQLKLSGERNPELYPHTLQFYKDPPSYTISLEQFEKLALERLQVLRIIDHAGAKLNRNSNEYRDAIISEMRKHNLSHYYKITTDEMNDVIYDERKRDHISHFILRLAYCKTEDMRRWFIAQEVDLFRLRFMSETGVNRKLFMDLNKLNFKPIDVEEKRALIKKLVASTFNNTTSKVENTDYYKVPFTEVLDLIRMRKVLLRGGLAYIPENDLVSIVVTAFRTHLSHDLAVTSHVLPQLEEDGRLLSILGTIHQRYIGTDYSTKKMQYTGEIAPEMIDELSKTSFPLCMRTLHESLRSSHHLKHSGRLQYGLFLKGIGLSLEDALRFFRQEFTKVMDTDKFDKQYLYNIRYNYGKEGKRTNYTPYNCMKIITTNAPGPGECHGCPFKHSDSRNLRQRLSNLKIGEMAISDITDLVEKNHYQVACTRYFEATHGENAGDQAISHPNQYFEESVKIKKNGPKEKKFFGKPKGAPSVMFSSQSISTQDSEIAAATCETDDFDMDDIEDLLKGV